MLQAFSGNAFDPMTIFVSGIYCTPYANIFKVAVHFLMVERLKCTHTSFELHKIRIMNINNVHDCTKKQLLHPISLAKQLRIIDWWWRKIIFQDSHVSLISLLIKITLPSCQRITMPTSRCNLYLCQQILHEQLMFSSFTSSTCICASRHWSQTTIVINLCVATKH